MRLLSILSLVSLSLQTTAFSFEIPVVSYTVSTPPSSAFPDTGGTELTDNAGKNIDVWPNETDPDPLVGWTNVDPEITFTFAYPINVGEIRLHLADSEGEEGVALPQLITVTTSAGFELEVEIKPTVNEVDGTIGTEVENPDGSGSVASIKLDGYLMNTHTDHVTITMTRSELGPTICLSEVEFFTSLKADASLDIQASIPQPETADVDGTAGRYEGRLRVYRTTLEKREGIIVLVDGFGATQPKRFNYHELPTSGEGGEHPNLELARDQLGFDVYDLDWYTGTGYMQKNAMVLVELLNRIHNGVIIDDDGEEAAGPEVPLQADEKLVLLPGSMGGVVSRYALAYMETEGIDHGVDLWMTVDSPHAGAYIPIGVQHLVDFLQTATLGLSEEVGEAAADINSPAAKQLLLVHHDNMEGELFHPQHKLFYDELREAYGNYPQAPTLRKVAIANGRGDGRNSIFKDDGSNNDIELGETEGRRILFSDKTRTVLSGTYDAEYKIRDRVVWEKEVDYRLKMGTVLEIWSTRPDLDNPFVFRARFVRRLFVEGEEVTLSSDEIRKHLFNVLDLPDIVSNSVVENIVGFLIAKAYDFELPDFSSARIDTDYVYEFLPGGLGRRTEEAADAISGNALVPRHSSIPATSAVGIVGDYNRPLEDIPASSTPFDTIYFEKGDNRSHVFYSKEVGADAFEQEISRILDAPTIFSTIPDEVVEGARGPLIVIKGIHFTENTVVLWNGAPRATTFISENEVRIQASDADVANSGTVTFTLEDPISEYTGLVTTAFEILPVQIDVSPSNFGPGDLLKFRYDGLWPNSNTPRDPVVTINGDTINVVATTPGGFSFPAFTAYSIQTEIGRPPAGNYTLIYSVQTGSNTDEEDRRTLDLRIPAPTIESISPSEMDTHGEPFTFEVIGSGFFTGDSVPQNEQTMAFWNDVEVPAVALSRSLLQVEIPPDAPISVVNTLNIVNPEPGGGSAAFEIPYTGTIVTSSVLRHIKTAEGAAQQVRVNGEKFGAGSTIFWNGKELATQYLFQDGLTATIPQESTTAIGDGAVTVLNHEGQTTPVFFTKKILPPNVLTVDQMAPVGGDGLSWDSAFRSLSLALAAASADTAIWVASGSYTLGLFESQNGFELVDGVALLGGFAGYELSSDQRNPDPATNATVLSADRLEDDASFGNISDNLYHVVTGSDLTSATVLDGFTIRGGNANSTEDKGGGIHLVNSSPLLRNLIIENNSAILGGALYSEGGSPQISDTIIRSNTANAGGGLVFSGGEPILDRIFVLGNRAAEGGGVLITSDASTTITHSVIAGNTSPAGAGLLSVDSNLNLQYVTLAGNEASIGGGAMHNVNSIPFLENCIIWGNSAPENAGISGSPLSAASSNNTIQGGHPSGTGTSDEDPLFIRAASSGSDEKWYPDSGDNDYGNLRLLNDSPASGRGAYEGTFESFANLYSELNPDEDANQDGFDNVFAYMLGQDPEGEPGDGLVDRIASESGRLNFELLFRTTDGEYETVNQLSGNLADWYPLNDGDGFSIEIETSEALPSGLTRLQGQILIDSPSIEKVYLESQLQPHSPWRHLRTGSE